MFMSKIVKLGNSDLANIVKKVISESLGVPTGIIDESKKIYQSFIENFSKRPDLEFVYDENVRINDLSAKDLTVKMELEPNQSSDRNYYILSYSTSSKTRQNGTERMKIVNDFDHLDIKILILVPKDYSYQELLNFLISEKNNIIESFSHELMHVYEGYKKKYRDVKQHSEYLAYSSFSLGLIPEIDKFTHLLYFTHAFENVVRPTEIATALDLNQIDQKKFLSFLKSHETYIKLKAAKNFSYEKFKENLKSQKNIELIDELGNIINHDMGSTDDEKVDELLRLVMINLTNEKGEKYKDLMTSNMAEELFGFRGQKLKNFKKYIEKIQRFQNPDDFFKNEEKYFNFVGDKMIRKISKLFAMTSSEDKSIKDWERYHKVKKTNENIDTEFKFKKT